MGFKWVPDSWWVLADVVGRSFIVYLVLLLGLRLTGRRQIGQLTPFDLVLLLLISNAVQNAMTGPDYSLLGGLVAAATLLTMNRAIAWLRLRYTGIERIVEGSPVPLVTDGKILTENLQKEQITTAELLANLREHNVEDIEHCELAMLEVDGTVSVFRRDPNTQEVVKSRKRLTHHHRHP